MFDPGDNQILLDMNQFSPRCTAWHDQSHNKMNLESEQSKRKTLISLTFYVCIACNVPLLPSLQWWNLYRSDVKCISSPLIACPLLHQWQQHQYKRFATASRVSWQLGFLFQIMTLKLRVLISPTSWESFIRSGDKGIHFAEFHSWLLTVFCVVIVNSAVWALMWITDRKLLSL